MTVSARNQNAKDRSNVDDGMGGAAAGLLEARQPTLSAERPVLPGRPGSTNKCMYSVNDNPPSPDRSVLVLQLRVPVLNEAPGRPSRLWEPSTK